jgi:hypothetical protein
MWSVMVKWSPHRLDTQEVCSLNPTTHIIFVGHEKDKKLLFGIADYQRVKG